MPQSDKVQITVRVETRTPEEVRAVDLPEGSVVAATDDERAEIGRMLAELHGAGYVDLDEYTYPRSGRVLRVGARIRHGGEQYAEALMRGTGHVVVLTHKPDSAWSRSWRMPDIELVMLRDEERFGSKLSQVAHYHVEVIEEATDDD